MKNIFTFSPLGFKSNKPKLKPISDIPTSSLHNRDHLTSTYWGEVTLARKIITQKVTIISLLALIFSTNHLAAEETEIHLLLPFFEQHCIVCHGPERDEGSLRIDQLYTGIDDINTLEDWQNILDEITLNSMPPEEEPQPSDQDLAIAIPLLTEYIRKGAEQYTSGGGKPVRRLTKIEYSNTVLDLLGVHINAEDLPDDGAIGGFDTEAQALYTTDLYFENYLIVARDAVRRFIASRSEEPGEKELLAKAPSKKDRNIVLNSNSQLPPAGHIKASFDFWSESPESKFTLTGDSGNLAYEVTGTEQSPQHIERHFYTPTSEAWSKHPDLGLSKIVYVQVISPQPYNFFKPLLTNSSDTDPSDLAAVSIIKKFVALINRGREVDQFLIDGLNQQFLAGRKRDEPFWEAIVEPMALAMSTIEAMFHFENKDPSKSSTYISAVELSNRLSYFLWRSAPDLELTKLAQSGEIYRPTIRTQQIERMMKDGKFDRFVRDFSNQWLELERQDLIAVDELLFQDFDNSLKISIKEETIQFMSHVIKNNLPLGNLVDSNFVLINNAMAKHYGMPKIEGEDFRVVKIPENSRRGGILTQAGILMQTGTGDRTSIVERGVFISKKLLSAEPPPPPPLVEDLPTEGEDFKKMTGAELVRQHASSVQCASCHNRIDPIGLGLEEFDAIGLYRTKDVRINPDFHKPTRRNRKTKTKTSPTFEVDLETTGRIFSGQSFQGAEGLKKELLKNQPRLARSYIEALFTFASGRKAGVPEKADVDAIVKETSTAHYPARAILKAVLESPRFKAN